MTSATVAAEATTTVPAGAGTSRRYRLMGRSLWHFVRTDVLTAVLAGIAALLVWEVVTLVVTAQWLPPPAHVLTSMEGLFGDPAFRSDLLASMGAALAGFAVAMSVGGLLGLAVATWETANHALRIYIDALLIVPSAMLAPVLVVVFGITWLNVIALATVFGTAIIAINTASAVRGLDRIWVEVGQTLGARGFTLMRRFVFPGILPGFLGGLYLGSARAFKGMIVGQVFLGVIGIGGYLARFDQAFDSAGIWAIAILVITMALILAWLIRALDAVLNFWAYRD